MLLVLILCGVATQMWITVFDLAGQHTALNTFFSLIQNKNALLFIKVSLPIH